MRTDEENDKDTEIEYSFKNYPIEIFPGEDSSFQRTNRSFSTYINNKIEIRKIRRTNFRDTSKF